jgi:hypothetical protein
MDGCETWSLDMFWRGLRDFLLFYCGVKIRMPSTSRDRAIAQAVSRRPSTAEAVVRSQASPCGICGGQSGTGTGFFPEYFGFSLSVSSTGAPLLGKMKKTAHLHLHYRVAQEALRLWCVRSICCGALYHVKKSAKNACMYCSMVCSFNILRILKLKGPSVLNWTRRHGGTWRSGGIAPSIPNLSDHCHIIPEKELRDAIGGFLGQRAGLNASEKSEICCHAKNRTTSQLSSVFEPRLARNPVGCFRLRCCVLGQCLGSFWNWNADDKSTLNWRGGCPCPWGVSGM